MWLPEEIEHAYQNWEDLINWIEYNEHLSNQSQAQREVKD